MRPFALGACTFDKCSTQPLMEGKHQDAKQEVEETITGRLDSGCQSQTKWSPSLSVGEDGSHSEDGGIRLGNGKLQRS